MSLRHLPAALALGAIAIHADVPPRTMEREPSEAIEALSRQFEQVAKAAAPYGEVAPGAQENARAQRNGMGRRDGAWTQVGNAPLYANDPAYTDVNDGVTQLGWVKLSARVTSFAFDPAAAGRYFLSVAGGGVWQSTNGGASWSSIGDSLPTQVVGAIAWTPYQGGTLIAGTGDNAMAGGLSLSGLGVYAAKGNLKSWTHAAGVPGGALTYRIAVDPSDPTGATVYVATSKGLYRSTDGGGSFTNVALPTTPSGYPVNCAGDTTTGTCFYANIVTDVVVRPADANGLGGGQVLAAVGWIASSQLKLRNPDGTLSSLPQSPQNGIYASATGAPGSFTFVNPGGNPTNNGFVPTAIGGRIALSVARGAGQDHNLVYAIVQDAAKVANCLDLVQAGLEIGTCLAASTKGPPTVLDGAYVSKDFGRTWTKIMDWSQLELPGTNSALGPYGAALGYAPGVQSWYNLWIDADPTATDAVTRAPTRVAFGLEEVWENAIFGEPQNGVSAAATPWRVIGRYWNACALALGGYQCNGASSPIAGTTTHPDQHAGVFVPDGAGGVTLLAGNDGGAYLQHVGAGQDFSNDRWGAGANSGLATLLPYHVAAAKDGTVVAGLQDNGEMKITPAGYEVMIYGGDGFFSAIDPDNSNNIAEEYAGGVVALTNDGGKTWKHVDPALTSPLFATPFQQDPASAGHLLIGGRDVEETTNAYTQPCTVVNTPASETCVGFAWTKVYDLGTANHPGVASATSSTSDPNNRLSAVDLAGDNAYVGYCGPCSGLGAHRFARGIATNVAGSLPPQRLTGNGWHIAAAAGLPTRYISSVRMDPSNPKTVYVTLGGYSTHWIPPGAVFYENVGAGHVFKSIDGGNTFTDVSGNLPDTPADWVVLHGTNLIVGTDIGVFISSSLDGGTWQVLGGLPAFTTAALAFSPADPNLLYAATFGRGIWSFHF
jgi:hypothetical protein